MVSDETVLSTAAIAKIKLKKIKNFFLFWNPYLFGVNLPFAIWMKRHAVDGTEMVFDAGKLFLKN